VGPVREAWKVRHWGNALSDVDFGSDANVLREVDGFRAQGFWHDAGLGNVLFGPRYPDAGFAPFGRRLADGSYAYPSPYLVDLLKHQTAAEIVEEFTHQLGPSGVYTHYPPGPEYLLYLDEAVLGPDPVWRLRLLPLAIGAGATLFHGLSIRRRFGVVASWIVILASLTVAPFSNAYTSLHDYGYALALLLVEVGVAIGGGRSSCWASSRAGYRSISSSWWFSRLWLSSSRCRSLSLVMRLAGGSLSNVVSSAGVGFAVAHLLHLVQVWAYYGSLSRAIADLEDSARFRAAGAQDLENGWSGTVISNLNHHLFWGHPLDVASGENQTDESPAVSTISVTYRADRGYEVFDSIHH
jgi:hypothetical protein